MKTLKLGDFVHLGQITTHLANPEIGKRDDYAKQIDALPKCLDACELPNTKAGATYFDGLMIAADSKGNVYDFEFHRLKAATHAITNTLKHEVGTKTAIILNTSGVSLKLRSLGIQIPTLNDTQKYLLTETIRCIECDAYRAAAVMGWSLAYDYIRRWMWDDMTRRNTFNVEIGKVRPGGLGGYEDFWLFRF